MDIIDIMLAKAMTPQGKTDAYLAKANRAAQRASAAEQSAAAAVATVEAAAESITDTQAAATQLLADAQAALAAAEAAQTEQIELYTTTGQNTDGTMTQKAITDALVEKADSSSLNIYVTTSNMNTALATKADVSALAAKADKSYVDEQIAAIPSGGNATINMNAADVNHLVKVDSNGNIVASLVTEDAVVDALLQTGAYVAKNAVGLDIDYINHTYTRMQEAEGKSIGADFNKYSMYGGRMRCNVTDDGTITAFYGDNNYTEDGSNGQVMVYQPKFYYRRIIRQADQFQVGQAIRREILLISPTEQTGFKIAPIFSGNLDYVLLPAFDGSIANNKLASVAGALPVNQLTIEEAEALATARGNGWHIMTMAAESATQMLEMVEFGTLNGQLALEDGIVQIPNGLSGIYYFITGSTSALGNGTGHATSTQVSLNGNVTTVNEAGYRAISYRGMENPWGNFWSMIGGTKVVGDYYSDGGRIYICRDFTYNGYNYGDVGFNLPSDNGWINAMGYGNEEYDWVYMPIECSNKANSIAPIGDSIWTTTDLNGTNTIAVGGSYGFAEACGPFYYAADRTIPETTRYNYGAKLLYIPTKNSIYTNNIAKWNTHMGG